MGWLVYKIIYKCLSSNVNLNKLKNKKSASRQHSVFFIHKSFYIMIIVGLVRKKFLHTHHKKKRNSIVKCIILDMLVNTKAS